MADSLKENLKKLPYSASKRELHCSTPLPLGKIRYQDKEFLDFTSWDFLNLSTHPGVIRAATKALHASGAGTNSSRLSTGTLQEHAFCEEGLAKFFCAEKGLLFSSKNQAVFTLITNLLTENDLIITQEEISSPVVDAAYLIGAIVKLFKGQNIGEVKDLAPPTKGKIVIFVEGCSLTTGEILFLDGIIAFAKKYGASIVVDETGCAGLLGIRGIGLSETHLHEPCIIGRLGEFSKGFSGYGGYLASSVTICNYLLNYSSAYANENSPPPSVMAGLTSAFDLVESSLEKRKEVLNFASFFRSELHKLQYNTIQGGPSAIVSVNHKSKANAEELKNALFNLGILVESVPRGTSRDNSWLNRFIFNSNIAHEHVQHTLQSLSDLRSKLL